MDPNNMGIDPHLAYLIPLFGIMALVGMAIVLIPLWQICKKAGFSPWLSLLVLLYPVGGLILLYVLAFARWKVVPIAQGSSYPPAAYPPAYPPAAYPPAAPPPATPGGPYQSS
jgi:hypothetical protein